MAAAGGAVYAGGAVFWRPSLSLRPDYAGHMLPGMLMTGTGVGLTLPTLVSAVVSAVPPHRFATGSGVVAMARQAGIVVGVALLVTVLGHPAGPGALAAFQRATVLIAAMAVSAGARLAAADQGNDGGRLAKANRRAVGPACQSRMNEAGKV